MQDDQCYGINDETKNRNFKKQIYNLKYTMYNMTSTMALTTKLKQEVKNKFTT